MTDTVSVVVCAYTEKRWDVLHRACTAAFAQLRADDTLVLVIDHNDALLERARAAFTGFDVVANSHARGLSGARNTALDKVTGDLIVFLDDDAVPRPGWLDALRAPYRDGAVYGVGGWAEAAWPDGRRPAHLPPELDWVVGCSYRGQPTAPARVRNLMGCNMSFRREVFDIVGGFDEAVGRVGTTPLGCEETQLCIRLRQARPDVELLLEPASVVDHTVSRDRLDWSYLRRRSFAEGVSKALIGDDVGKDAMSTEIAYTRSVLPAGVRRDLARLRRGETGAAASAAAVPVALACFAAGYLGGSRKVRGTGKGVVTPAFAPVHVGTIDLADPVPDEGIAVDPASGGARLLVRVGRAVLGVANLPVHAGTIPAGEVRAALAGYASAADDNPVDDSPADDRARPSSAVVIATAGRPAAVERCVDSILRGSVVPDEIVVVDNAPHRGDHATALRAIADRERLVRYVAQPRAGASLARNTGVDATTAEIVATVDDDVVVDRFWLAALLGEFADPDTHMVTGLVQPLELDTAAQVWFEELGGFGKGFDRLVFRADDRTVHPLFPYAPGMVGSGNNLAFRRSAWVALGGMSELLGPGSPVPAGEDLDLFLRHLLAGRAIVYTPHALVWHEHRRTEDDLVAQVRGYGQGLSAVYAKLLLEDPLRLTDVARRTGPGLRRLFGSSRRRPVTHPAGPTATPPRVLRRAELRGVAGGAVALARARRSARTTTTTKEISR